MDTQLLLAILTAKKISLATRLFFKGGGTAAPGLCALKVDPKVIRKLTGDLKKGSIVVAGTNGKTTTSRMIGAMISANGSTVVHNKEGSNLLRGVASALTASADWFGKITKDYGVWEIDEATLPLMLHEIQPRMIVLTNLFRDQLDRYGEVAKIRTIWQKALAELAGKSTLILNADDPSIAHLGHQFKGEVLYFGLEHRPIVDEVNVTADANFCTVCSSPLDYEAIYYSHIGKYNCPKCGFTRPQPQIIASNIEESETQSTFALTTSAGKQTLKLPIPGIYNIYNALAAVATAQVLAIPQETSLASLSSFSSVFGRTEHIMIGDKELRLYLVKNPTGLNEVIHVLSHAKEPYPEIVVGLNDNFADGRDVSWIWDANFEELVKHGRQFIATGTRAFDIANRLKYANVEHKPTVVEDTAAVYGVVKTSQTKTIPMLLTYTALLEFRQYLAKKGHITHYLKE